MGPAAVAVPPDNATYANIAVMWFIIVVVYYCQFSIMLGDPGRVREAAVESLAAVKVAPTATQPTVYACVYTYEHACVRVCSPRWMCTVACGRESERDWLALGRLRVACFETKGNGCRRYCRKCKQCNGGLPSDVPWCGLQGSPIELIIVTIAGSARYASIIIVSLHRSLRLRRHVTSSVAGGFLNNCIGFHK